MRKVNRTQFSIPNRLQNLTVINTEQLNDSKTISNSVYGHDDVKYSLTQLYFEKCYICECDVSSERYDIEHYLPKKHFPQLGYTWSNLHKSCEGCNLAKESNDFAITDDAGKFIDIKLLDPSSTNYDINDYIKFDLDSKAELVGRGHDALVIEKAINTIRYLNGGDKSVYGKGLPYLRENRSKKFLQYCVEFLVEHKPRIRQIILDVDHYTSPENRRELIADQEICHRISAIDLLFLADKAPFSTNVRAQLYPTLKMHYDLLKIMREKMSEVLRM